VSHLTIKNNSKTKNIVFKIRTTQPICYVVKPNSGILEAMGTAVAEIQYHHNEVSSRRLTYFNWCSTGCSEPRVDQVPSASGLHRVEGLRGKCRVVQVINVCFARSVDQPVAQLLPIPPKVANLGLQAHSQHGQSLITTLAPKRTLCC